MCFEKVVHIEVGWFDDPKHSSGVIGTRLSTYAGTLRALVGDALTKVVQDSTTVVAGLVTAFIACWQLAFIVLALVPLVGVGHYVQMKLIKGLSADAKQMYEKRARLLMML